MKRKKKFVREEKFIYHHKISDLDPDQLDDKKLKIILDKRRNHVCKNLFIKEFKEHQKYK